MVLHESNLGLPHKAPTVQDVGYGCCVEEKEGASCCVTEVVSLLHSLQEDIRIKGLMGMQNYRKYCLRIQHQLLN